MPNQSPAQQQGGSSRDQSNLEQDQSASRKRSRDPEDDEDGSTIRSSGQQSNKMDPMEKIMMYGMVGSSVTEMAGSMAQIGTSIQQTQQQSKLMEMQMKAMDAQMKPQQAPPGPSAAYIEAAKYVPTAAPPQGMPQTDPMGGGGMPPGGDPAAMGGSYQ
jgi:hypothetical protein